jgi:hypothetical protein
MAGKARLVEAPAEEARIWTEDSLEQGCDLSAAVLAGGFLDRGQFLAVVSDPFLRAAFAYETGGVIGQRHARDLLAQVLNELGSRNARGVLVEDNVHRRSDPSFSIKGEPSAFIGDCVLHWRDFSEGSTKAMEVVAWGATGYPTNAFIVNRSSRDFGLIDRRDAPANLAQEVASSLLAIVVAAFDAESFLLWIADSSVGPAPLDR